MVINKNYKPTIFIVIILLIIVKIFVLINFSIKWVDEDQALLWLTAKDLSRGLFYQPNFYGQAYSSSLEALFAVPATWLKVPPNIALPIITIILSSLPFIIVGLFFIKNNNLLAGILSFLMPLTLNIEYDLITSMPRGLVTGIFVQSLVIIFFNKTPSTFNGLIISFLTSLAFCINPNSVLLVIPLVFLYLRYNKITKELILGFITGLFLGTIVFVSKLNFYNNFPEYIMHKSPKFKFRLDLLDNGLKNINIFFDAVTPFNINPSLFFIFFFLLSIYLIYKKKYLFGVMILLFLLSILASFGIRKIYDNHYSIFFASERMYLAFPFCLCIMTGIILNQKVKFRKSIKLFLIFFIVSLTIFKIFNLFSFNKNKNNFKDNTVQIAKTTAINKNCSIIKDITTKHEIDYVIYSKWGDNMILNYACPTLIDDFPKSFLPSSERRIWIKNDFFNQENINILVYIVTNKFLKSLKYNNIRYERIKAPEFSIKILNISGEKFLKLNLKNF